eukprot:s1774_g12.t2
MVNFWKWPWASQTRSILGLAIHKAAELGHAQRHIQAMPFFGGARTRNQTKCFCGSCSKNSPSEGFLKLDVMDPAIGREAALNEKQEALEDVMAESVSGQLCALREAASENRALEEALALANQKLVALGEEPVTVASRHGEVERQLHKQVIVDENLQRYQQRLSSTHCQPQHSAESSHRRVGWDPQQAQQPSSLDQAHTMQSRQPLYAYPQYGLGMTPLPSHLHKQDALPEQLGVKVTEKPKGKADAGKDRRFKSQPRANSNAASQDYAMGVRGTKEEVLAPTLLQKTCANVDPGPVTMNIFIPPPGFKSPLERFFDELEADLKGSHDAADDDELNIGLVIFK